MIDVSVVLLTFIAVQVAWINVQIATMRAERD